MLQVQGILPLHEGLPQLRLLHCGVKRIACKETRGTSREAKLVTPRALGMTRVWLKEVEEANIAYVGLY